MNKRIGRKMLKRNEEAAVRTLRDELSQRFNIFDFRIFGSKVKGTDTPGSDIDVMIEIDELNPAIESQIDDIIYEINLKNNTFISAIIFSKKELEEGPMSESPIYKLIQKEGMPI